MGDEGEAVPDDGIGVVDAGDGLIFLEGGIVHAAPAGLHATFKEGVLQAEVGDRGHGIKVGGLGGRFGYDRKQASFLVESYRMPLLGFEAFDPFKFDNIARDESGPNAAGLGGDEKVQRADGFTGGFQFGTDFRVVEGGDDAEVGDVE